MTATRPPLDLRRATEGSSPLLPARRDRSVNDRRVGSDERDGLGDPGRPEGPGGPDHPRRRRRRHRPPPHPREHERLDALYRLRVLDGPPAEQLDRLTALAASLFNVPDRPRLARRRAPAMVPVPRRDGGDRDAARPGVLRPRAATRTPCSSSRTPLADPRFATNPLVLGEPFVPLLRRRGAARSGRPAARHAVPGLAAAARVHACRARVARAPRRARGGASSCPMNRCASAAPARTRTVPPASPCRPAGAPRHRRARSTPDASPSARGARCDASDRRARWRRSCTCRRSSARTRSSAGTRATACCARSSRDSGASPPATGTASSVAWAGARLALFGPPLRVRHRSRRAARGLRGGAAAALRRRSASPRAGPARGRRRRGRVPPTPSTPCSGVAAASSARWRRRRACGSPATTSSGSAARSGAGASRPTSGTRSSATGRTWCASRSSRATPVPSKASSACCAGATPSSTTSRRPTSWRPPRT